MTLRSEYPEILLDAWCCHEAFRRFGFSADEIFMHVSQNGEQPGAPWLFSVLKAQGKEFTITIGPLGDQTPEALMALWHQFAAVTNARSPDDAEMQEIWEKGIIWRIGPTNLAMGLMNKGFRFPRATVTHA